MSKSNFQIQDLPTVKIHENDSENCHSYGAILVKTSELSFSTKCKTNSVVRNHNNGNSIIIEEASFEKDKIPLELIKYDINPSNENRMTEKYVQPILSMNTLLIKLKTSQNTNATISKVKKEYPQNYFLTISNVKGFSGENEVLVESFKDYQERLRLKRATLESVIDDSNHEIIDIKLKTYNEFSAKCERVEDKILEISSFLTAENKEIIDLIIYKIFENIEEIWIIEIYENNERLKNSTNNFSEKSDEIKTDTISEKLVFPKRNVHSNLCKRTNRKDIFRLSCGNRVDGNALPKSENKTYKKNKSTTSVLIKDSICERQKQHKVYTEQEDTYLQSVIPFVSKRDTEPWSPVYVKQNNVWPQLPAHNNHTKNSNANAFKRIPSQKCDTKVRKERNKYEEFRIPRDGILGRDINESKFLNFCCNTCRMWISLGNRDKHFATCFNSKKLSKDSLGKLKSRSIKRMPGIVCFICGGRFTFRTINNHEDACLLKWIKYNDQFNICKPVPVKPEIINSEIELHVAKEVKLGNVDFTAEDAINEVYYNASRNNILYFNN